MLGTTLLALWTIVKGIIFIAGIVAIVWLIVAIKTLGGVKQIIAVFVGQVKLMEKDPMYVMDLEKEAQEAYDKMK